MINFPDSPTVGSQFTSGGAVWQWDGAKWVSIPSTSGSGYVAKSGDTMTGPLKINETGTALPPDVGSPDSIHIAAVSGQPSVITVDASANGSYVILRRSDGTWASKTPPSAGETIGLVGASGYANGAYLPGSPGFMNFVAANTWSATDTSVYIQFATTPVGSTAGVDTMRLQPSGGVSIGSAAFSNTDPGQGILAVQNGVQINPTGVALPAPLVTTVMQIGGTSGAGTRSEIIANAGVANLSLRRLDGSWAAPTALAANETIGTIAAIGYDPSGPIGGANASAQFVTYNAWTTSDHSTKIILYTTPINATSSGEAVRVQPSGGVSVGNAAFNTTDPGQGVIAAQNGVQLPAGSPVHDNRVINGGFDVWQLGTSFNINNATLAYTADQWVAYNPNLTVVADVAQVAAPAGFVGSKALQWWAAGAAAGGTMNIIQRFEAAQIADLDGKAITISFDMLASTTAGSLSGQVTFQSCTAPDNGSYTSTFNIGYTPPTTASRVVVSVPAASTVGMKNGGQLYINIGQQGATGNPTVIIGAVKMEKGPLAQPWVPKGIAREIMDCQRYFQKSNWMNQAPGSVQAGGAGGAASYGQNWCISGQLHPPMRVAPTMVMYDNAGSSGKFSYYNGAWVNGGVGNGIGAQSEQSWQSSGSAVGAQFVNFDFTADARL